MIEDVNTNDYTEYYGQYMKTEEDFTTKPGTSLLHKYDDESSVGVAAPGLLNVSP